MIQLSCGKIDFTSRDIDLQFNDIGDEGVRPIATAIRHNQVLQILDLSYNDNITDAGAKELSNALEENDTITDIHLSGTCVSDSMLLQINQRLAHNKNLQHIARLTSEEKEDLILALQSQVRDLTSSVTHLKKERDDALSAFVKLERDYLTLHSNCSNILRTVYKEQ